MHVGMLVAAGVALVGAIIAFVWLPARASYDDVGRAGRHRAPVPSGRAGRRSDAPEVVTDADVIAEARRRPGRPRSAEADEAILEAAVELFAEVGLDGLTVEGVAARAGVGKATIYRRYPCKVDLVVAASRCFTPTAPDLPPDTGSTRGDLRALVDGLITMLTTTPIGRVAADPGRRRAPASPSSTGPTPRSSPRSGRAPRPCVRRGIERGDLRADVDLELVVDCYVSPIFYRFLITDAPLDDAFAAAVVDTTSARSAPDATHQRPASATV